MGELQAVILRGPDQGAGGDEEGVYGGEETPAGIEREASIGIPGYTDLHMERRTESVQGVERGRIIHSKGNIEDHRWPTAMDF